MFTHNFKYSLKTLFKNKTLIFWTFAFPIILGTFFNMAFSNIEKNETLSIIDIAIVENDEFKNNKVFLETIKTLSDKENEKRLFDTKYVDINEAKKLLSNKKITGYLILEDTPKIIVNSSGINETILKYVIDEITQNEIIINNIINNKIKNNVYTDEIYNEVMQKLESNININHIQNQNLSYTMIEYYTLIALACLYGGILGMSSVGKTQANMCSTGKRISVSSTSKIKIIFSSILASYIVELIGIILLFLYTIFIIKVDYGNNLILVILLSVVGSLTGLSLGILITTVLKSNFNIKLGIIISTTTLLCFLSGMMGITMKYTIDKNIPIINKINPASMITDGFYSLYYYGAGDRFYFNIISLLISAGIMVLISLFSLRRKKYDSI